MSARYFNHKALNSPSRVAASSNVISHAYQDTAVRLANTLLRYSIEKFQLDFNQH